MAAKRPRLLVPIVVVICSGNLACISAFFTRRFALLFLSAGSLPVLVLSLPSMVARTSLSARAQQNLSRDCVSSGLSHFRVHMVHHGLARPLS
jgi:hypothetical protein